MLRPAGMRAMTTLRKLPTQRPKSAQNTTGISGEIIGLGTAQFSGWCCPTICAEESFGGGSRPRGSSVGSASERQDLEPASPTRPIARLRNADAGRVARVGDGEGARRCVGGIVIGTPAGRTRRDGRHKGAGGLTQRVGGHGGEI